MVVQHVGKRIRKFFDGQFVYLLICQTALFIIFPFLNYNDLSGKAILEFLYMAVLFSCLRVVAPDNREMRLLVFGLLMLSISLKLLDYIFKEAILVRAGLSVDIVFHLVLSIIIVHHVMKSERVSTDKIIGALCAYLFIGVLFSQVFALIEFVSPGSFAMSAPLQQTLGSIAGAGRGMAFFYFSFITLTTVGYGDVTPLSQPATTFSVLEAIIGQIYMTVLIARLVGLHIAYERTTEGSKC